MLCWWQSIDVNFFNFINFDNFFNQSVFDVDGSVGELGESLVVGDDDEGLPKLITQVKEELVQFLLVLGIEGARGFVGKDDGGVVDECPCHSHTLFLATREFGGLMLDAVAEVQIVEQFLGAHLCLLFALASDEGWNADVLQRRELRQELVELEDEAEVLVAEMSKFLVFETGHIDAVNANGASVRGVEGAHNLKERGLACS